MTISTIISIIQTRSPSKKVSEMCQMCQRSRESSITCPVVWASCPWHQNWLEIGCLFGQHQLDLSCHARSKVSLTKFGKAPIPCQLVSLHLHWPANSKCDLMAICGKINQMALARPLYVKTIQSHKPRIIWIYFVPPQMGKSIFWAQQLLR